MKVAARTAIDKATDSTFDAVEFHRRTENWLEFRAKAAQRGTQALILVLNKSPTWSGGPDQRPLESSGTAQIVTVHGPAKVLTEPASFAPSGENANA